MDKQTTIAFILIGAILVLWLYISAPDPNNQPKPKSNTTQTTDSLITNKPDTTYKVIEKTVDKT